MSAAPLSMRACNEYYRSVFADVSVSTVAESDEASASTRHKNSRDSQLQLHMHADHDTRLTVRAAGADYRPVGPRL